MDEVNCAVRSWGAYFRVGNATRKFRDVDHYVRERLAKFLAKKAGRGGHHRRRYTWGVLREAGGLPTDRNRQGVHGSADSGAVKDGGKPGAGEPHARFDERGLETEHGLGTAAPAPSCLDSAGPSGHRASPRLYPGAVWRCGRCRGHLSGPQGKHRPRIILR